MNQSAQSVPWNFGELSEEYSLDKYRVQKVISRLQRDLAQLRQLGDKRELILTLTTFVCAESQLAQREKEVETIFSKWAGADIPELVKDKCIGYAEELRNYWLFLDELSVNTKVFNSSPRNAEKRGEQLGSLLLSLIISSVAIGLEFGTRGVNEDSVRDVVQLLRVASEPMYQFAVILLVALAKDRNINETEIANLGEFGQLGRRLVRMLSVESCIEGLHLAQDLHKEMNYSKHSLRL
jgi:hypothetical protein